MGGGVLALLLSSPGAQSSEGSLQPVSSSMLSGSRTSMSPTLYYVRGFPFYSSRWGPLFTYIYCSVLVLHEGPSSSSVVRPRPVGWEWRGSCQVGFLGRRVVWLLSRPWSVGVAWPLGRSLGGHLLSCPSIPAPPSVALPRVPPCVASARRTARPLMGALPQSDGAVLSHPLA